MSRFPPVVPPGPGPFGFPSGLLGPNLHITGNFTADGDITAGNDLVAFHQVQAVDKIISDLDVVALRDVEAGRNVQVDTGGVIATAGGVAAKNLFSTEDTNVIGNLTVIGDSDLPNIKSLTVDGRAFNSFVLRFQKQAGILKHFFTDYLGVSTVPSLATKIFNPTNATSTTPALDAANGFLNRGCGTLVSDPTQLVLDCLNDQAAVNNKLLGGAFVEEGIGAIEKVALSFRSDNIGGITRTRLGFQFYDDSAGSSPFDLTDNVKFPNLATVTVRFFVYLL